MPPPFQSDIATPEVEHGGLDRVALRARGIDPDSILDFSANLSPFPPAPEVLQAAREAIFNQYPDRECRLLRAALSETLGVSARQIVAGNGSSELLHLLAQATLAPGDRVLVFGPTYGEYGRAASLFGADVSDCLAQAQDDFLIPNQTVLNSLETMRPTVCFLCHPNNPTGSRLVDLPPRELAARFPATVFVIDEAYGEFVPGETLVRADLPNVVVLRSLTKLHGLAGVRLGFAIAPLPTADRLRRVRIPWSVSSIAQVAGVAALAVEGHTREVVRTLVAGRQQLCEGFTELGYRCQASETSFFLARVGSGTRFRDRLLESGCLVRDATSFGLPEFIRVSSRIPADNERLLDVMRKLTSRGPTDVR